LPFHETGINIVAEVTVRCSVFQRPPQWCARENHISWQTIYFCKSLIARNKPLLIVDHAEPERHIVHRGVESIVLLARQRAEAIVAAANDDIRVRFCVLCASSLSVENEFKEDHQPHAYRKRANGHG
jgi:hypothetical protein